MDLLDACRLGDAARVVECLRQGKDPNQLVCCTLPLSEALRNKRTNVVKVLLNAECDVEAQEPCGATPLYWAWRYDNKQFHRTKLLVEKGASTRSLRYGMDLIHFAVMENQLDLVAWLLRQGNDPNARSQSGRAPVMYAAEESNVEMLRLLKEWNAEFDCVDADGWSATHYAVLGSICKSMAGFHVFVELGNCIDWNAVERVWPHMFDKLKEAEQIALAKRRISLISLMYQ